MTKIGPPITEEELHASVDGLLGAERQQAVACYLQHHPEVAQRVSAYHAQRERLQAVFAPRAAEPVPPALNLARLIEARLLSQRRSGWQIAVSAVLAFGVGSAAGWLAKHSRCPRGSGRPDQ